MRYYDSDYSDGLKKTLRDTNNALDNSYLAAINATSVTCTDVSYYKEDAVSVANDASAKVNSIVEKINDVNAKLAVFYDHSFEVGENVYQMASSVNSILQNIISAMNGLSSLLKGVGKYSGVMVTPDSIIQATSPLADIDEDVDEYYRSYFLDDDGNFNDEAMEDYCEYINNCPDPENDFFAVYATNALVDIYREKLDNCENIDEYAELQNYLLSYFYEQNTDEDFSASWWYANNDGDNGDKLDDGTFVEVCYYTYEFSDAGSYFVDVFNAKLPHYITYDYEKDHPYIVDFGYSMALIESQMSMVSVPITANSDYMEYRRNHFVGEVDPDLEEGVDGMPICYDRYNVDYPFPGFIYSEYTTEWGAPCIRMEMDSSIVDTERGLRVVVASEDTENYYELDESVAYRGKIDTIDICPYDSSINLTFYDNYVKNNQYEIESQMLTLSDLEAAVWASIIDLEIDCISEVGTVLDIFSLIGAEINYFRGQNYLDEVNKPLQDRLDAYNGEQEFYIYSTNCGGFASWYCFNKDNGDSVIQISSYKVNIDIAQRALGYYSYINNIPLVLYNSDEGDSILHTTDPMTDTDLKEDYENGLHSYIEDYFKSNGLSLPESEFSIYSDDYALLVSSYNDWCFENDGFYTDGAEANISIPGFHPERYQQ